MTFKRDGAIETFLPGAKYYALSTATDFLQQFVIAKVSEQLSRSRGLPSNRHALRARRGEPSTEAGSHSSASRARPFSSRQAGQTATVASAEFLLRTFRKRCWQFSFDGPASAPPNEIMQEILSYVTPAVTAIKCRNSSCGGLCFFCPPPQTQR